jgi:hypothetical protein
MAIIEVISAGLDGTILTCTLRIIIRKISGEEGLFYGTEIRDIESMGMRHL